MHVLVTNDDGPPSNQSSPYVHSLVSALQSAGHTVSVVVPHVQRSWIGKAHLIGQTLTPSYFSPGTLHNDDGITSVSPFENGEEEWVLIDGTPASCVQIGLGHLFRDRGPVDVVVSGPNYGRNTTALFCLSSGTLGGAMEAAVCGKKAIALSYAFDNRNHDPEIIAAASTRSCKLVEKLVADWPEQVQIFNINVPLKSHVAEAKILYTNILQNQWESGSSFEEVGEIDADEDPDPNTQEKEIREAKPESDQTVSKSGIDKRQPKKYKWAPRFSDVIESVKQSSPGNDGWAVAQGNISVTPLKANFWQLSGFEGEIHLAQKDYSIAPSSMKSRAANMVYAIIDYSDPYVQPLVMKALQSWRQGLQCTYISSIEQLESPESNLLQFRDYESLDFEHCSKHPQTSLVGSYIIRKALVRKHFLSLTISTWLAKHPDSLLKRHCKNAVHFEVDYAEFLDDSLVDAWDLNESMNRNKELEQDDQKEWWILKPGMSDAANGIRVFSSSEQLQSIFDEWEGVRDEDGDEDEEVGSDAAVPAENRASDAIFSNGIMASHLRHFVAQPYIIDPLLLVSQENHKFHIRVYVLAVGALKVYVYKEMLALFAQEPYQLPGVGGDPNRGLAAHLTNTCLHADLSAQVAPVARFWELAANEGMQHGWKEKVFDDICAITGEIFEAAAREQVVHFQCLPNAFEIFGVDFLIDARCNSWLLEVNAYPDFRQTGQALQEIVVGGLFDEVVAHAVRPFYRRGESVRGEAECDGHRKCRGRLVKDMSLGRR